MTKELLESTVNNLRLALVSTGIHVDRIDVQQQNNMSQAVHQAANAQSSQLHQQKRNADQHDDQQNKKNKNSGRFTVEELEELALDFINENQIDKRFLNFNDSGTVVNYTA
jgi:flagellar hook-length control protein FliK